MKKYSKIVKFSIPPYKAPRKAWRKMINDAAVRACKGKKVKYLSGDEVEVNVKIYFDETDLKFHDVDNRLKDVLDALQGRFGGPKGKEIQKGIKRIIQTDSQVYRATVEKSLPPKLTGGHVIIRKIR